MYSFSRIIFTTFLLIFLISTNSIAIATSEINISHKSGFYKNDIHVTIDSQNPDIKIFYTLDGSAPDPENPNNSFIYKNNHTYPYSAQDFEIKEQKTYLYQAPIKITDRTKEENSIANFNTTLPPEMPIRADSFKNKIINASNKAIVFVNRSMNDVSKYYHRYVKNSDIYEKKDRISLFNYEYEANQFIFTPPNASLLKGTPLKILVIDTKNNTQNTYNYIYFIGDAYQNIQLPIVNFNITEESLFNYKNGTFVAGSAYEEWLKHPKSDNKPYYERKFNWHNKEKHDSHISIFNNHNLTLDEDVAFKIHGLKSRSSPNKSIRAYFKFDEKGNHIFPDIKHKAKTRIIFRNAGGAYKTTYLNDVIFAHILKPIGIEHQEYQPYVSFINGEYNGILNARERRDEYYIKHKYNLPNKNIDHIKNIDEIVMGDDFHWKKFIDFLKSSNKKNAEFINKVQQHMDIDNFIDYHIAEIFIANMDWLTNNIAVWRYKTETPKAKNIKDNDYIDGRWRWLLYDLDEAGKNYKRNNIDFTFKLERRNANLVIKNLLENEDFKQLFIQRFSDLLNTHFTSDKTIPVVKKLAKVIEPEMPNHIERWGNPESMHAWKGHLDDLIDFLTQRPKYQWQHMQESFNLGNLQNINIIAPNNNSLNIKLNSLDLDNNFWKENSDTLSWDGAYFDNYKIKLSAIPLPGHTFSHWEIKTDVVDIINSSTIEVFPKENMTIKAVMN